uniref:Uncharacterized protein n=1 Tax=Pyxicephalus adspersus TaxID=30357 RepID=A0AAV3ABT9_PYXAD|nr:TPA: hypothetical protein GDO54_018370 [Pyxicephalus adspersus]
MHMEVLGKSSDKDSDFQMWSLCVSSLLILKPENLRSSIDPSPIALCASPLEPSRQCQIYQSVSISMCCQKANILIKCSSVPNNKATTQFIALKI